MSASGKLYGLFLKSLANKEVDLDSDSIKVMLCTSAYLPSQTTHQYKSDVTGEVAGTGYTAGGVALTGVTVTFNAGTKTFTFDASDVSWANSTITARFAVVYDGTPGTDATRPLIGYIDFGADVSTTAGTFQITWDTAGIVALSVS